MGKFKIVWIDATMTNRPSEMFPHRKLTMDDGEWKEYEVWDYFTANSVKDAKDYVKDYEFWGRDVEVFSVFVKDGRKWKLAFTEENY